LAIPPLLDAASVRAAEQMIEAVAAQVGNEIVLASEVLELSGPVEQRMRESGAPESQVLQVRKDALERLIEAKLVGSVVERLELGADRQEVDQAVSAIAQDNGLTVEQLLTSVESHGLTEESYRGKIREEIERSKVVNAMVRSRVQISEEEVRALYAEEFEGQRSGGEEFYLRHIVVMAGPQAGRNVATACAIAEDARNRIVSGRGTFAETAQEVSDIGAQRGGDLGWMHRDDLAPWMLATVDGMEPGKTSEVIELPFGCNLLELVDRREFRPIEFAQAEPQLRAILFQRKTEEEYSKWLEILREQTYIERKGAFAGSSRIGG
jgi:peptidyl-prolyl cis-trans isomerase SurA